LIPLVTGPLLSPQKAGLKGCAAPPFISPGTSHLSSDVGLFCLIRVKWKGLPDTADSEASWEPVQNLWQFKRKIEEYEDRKATRTLPE